MEQPPPNPAKLLDHWMQWERGEIPPGELMKQFKIGGLRQLLESLVDEHSSDTTTTVGDVLDG